MCLACSALYHTMSCHSHKTSTAFARVDYAGIPWLVVGGMLSWLQLAFAHDHAARALYSTVIPIVGLLTVIVSLSDTFNAREYREEAVQMTKKLPPNSDPLTRKSGTQMIIV